MSSMLSRKYRPYICSQLDVNLWIYDPNALCIIHFSLFAQTEKTIQKDTDENSTHDDSRCICDVGKNKRKAHRHLHADYFIFVLWYCLTYSLHRCQRSELPWYEILPIISAQNWVRDSCCGEYQGVLYRCSNYGYTVLYRNVIDRQF